MPAKWPAVRLVAKMSRRGADGADVGRAVSLGLDCEVRGAKCAGKSRLTAGAAATGKGKQAGEGRGLRWERRVPAERVQTMREKRALRKRGYGYGSGSGSGSGNNCRCPSACCWAHQLIPQARRARKVGNGGWAMTDGGREMLMVVFARCTTMRLAWREQVSMKLSGAPR